jgi:hypothetical protein
VATDENPKPGVRWHDDADGRGGTLGFPRQVTAFHAIAALWNLILPVVTLKPGSGLFLAIGCTASLVFAYFLARSLKNRAHVRMDGGQLTVTQGPWWPRAAFFSHPLADIASFEVAPSKEFENAYDLFLVTKNDLRVRLPMELNGIVVRVKGSKRASWGHAPVSHASYVAERLTEALDQVRHEGGSYRLAPGTGVGTEPGVRVGEELDAEAPSQRLRR